MLLPKKAIELPTFMWQIILNSLAHTQKEFLDKLKKDKCFLQLINYSEHKVDEFIPMMIDEITDAINFYNGDGICYLDESQIVVTYAILTKLNEVIIPNSGDENFELQLALKNCLENTLLYLNSMVEILPLKIPD